MWTLGCLNEHSRSSSSLGSDTCLTFSSLCCLVSWKLRWSFPSAKFWLKLANRLKCVRRIEETRADKHTNKHWKWSLFPLIWTCKEFASTFHHTSFHLGLILCKFTIALALKYCQQSWMASLQRESIACLSLFSWSEIISDLQQIISSSWQNQPDWGQMIANYLVSALVSHGMLAHV